MTKGKILLLVLLLGLMPMQCMRHGRSTVAYGEEATTTIEAPVEAKTEAAVVVETKDAFSAPESTEVVESKPAPWWWERVLGVAETVITTICGLILAVIGLFVKRKLNLNEAESQALEALKIAIQNTYETYIRQIRIAYGDRKLTEDERAQAMRLTLAKAKEIGSSDAVKLLEAKGTEWAKTKVEHLLITIKEKIAGASSASEAKK